MKKLFTLVALLAVFLGANAKEIVDAEVDFSKYTDISEVKWAGWGASESAKARLSIVDGCLHFQSDEATDPTWDCQFHPIGFGNNAEPGVTYTLHFKVKGDHAENISALGFGLTPYGQFPITTDWVEGTFDYEASGTSGDILFQCGGFVGTWDIAYLKITHEGKEERPVEWLELITNGDAETPWTDDQKAVKFTETEKTINICAWSKEKDHNLNDDNGWDPFPANIVVDPTNADNHVFICDGQAATTEGDPSAWDNQFWIMSPKELKVGAQYKVSFRYMATEAANTNTQMHSAQPSDYLHYAVLGDVAFGTTWQTYDQVVTIPEPQNKKPIHSIAFNLNAANKNAVKFYFDDLSICEMKLEHGFFVAASNTNTGIEYDFDNAIEFTDNQDGTFSATVGTKGKPDTYVNEIMISTVRGNDRMFKASTIKPSGTFIGEDNWDNYVSGSSAKINLQGEGVFTIMLAPNADETTGEFLEGGQLNIVMVEGTKKDPVDIVTNTTEFIVHAVERDDLTDGTKKEKDPETGEEKTVPDVKEEEGGTGQPWDNQFWIAANRDLKKDEVTVIKFKYKSSIDAKTSTQCHKMGGDKPCTYMHWGAIGDVNFAAGDYVEFEKEYTVPAEADGMRSFTFNMAEIRSACDYYIKDVQWYVKEAGLEEGKTYENLINAEGTTNFWVKIGADSAPYQYGTDPSGIQNVTAKSAKTSTAIYNLAGQRVSNGFKGLVIKDGKKFVK